MDSRVRGTQSQTSLPYEEFEPLCTWQREDGQDILVIHLPEFKKEQLRIQISSSGVMKITGENIIEGRKRSRFVKEIKEVTKDYDSSNIHAKFSQGRLRITLPKVALKPSMPDPEIAAPSPQEDQNDKASANAKTDIPDSKSRVGQVLTSKTFTQVMVNVGFVVFVAFRVYTAYKYWTSNISYVPVDED